METVLENLVEGLLDAGVQVNTLVSGQDTSDRVSTVRGPICGKEGRLVRMSRAGQLNSQPLNTTMLSRLRQEIEIFQPDLVHLHLPNPLAAMAWMALNSFYGRRMPKLAVWHHADITRQRVGAKFVRPLIQSIFKKSQGICVSTESLAKNSKCLVGRGEKTKVIPFGINPEPWINLQPSHSGPFLFVGRLVPYKGVEILLDAIVKVPGSQLNVVGNGPLESSLNNKLVRLNLVDRVKIHNSCNAQQLNDLMSEARALVLPSLDQSETFGLVQLEAMAAGVPVIASKLPSGVAEVGISGETCLLVPPADAAALASALTRMQNEPGLARTMGAASRNRFQTCFTREIMVKKVVEWYQQLLETDPQKGLK